MPFDPVDNELDAVAKQVVDAAFAVHSELGPGLLESAYEACLVDELVRRGLKTERQVQLPVHYKGKKVDAGFRIDLLVEGRLIVELKAVEKVLDIHKAQVLTYLKLANLRLGFVINFNVKLIKDGIERFVL